MGDGILLLVLLYLEKYSNLNTWQR